MTSSTSDARLEPSEPLKRIEQAGLSLAANQCRVRYIFEHILALLRLAVQDGVKIV